MRPALIAAPTDHLRSALDTPDQFDAARERFADDDGDVSIAGVRLDDVIDLPFGGRTISYLRFAQPDGVSVLRRTGDELVWGPVGSTEDAAYAELAAPFAAWRTEQDAPSIDARVAELTRLYRAAHPDSAPQIMRCSMTPVRRSPNR